MSTRSVVIIKQSKPIKMEAWLYHHHDGYPEGVGAKLKKECNYFFNIPSCNLNVPYVVNKLVKDANDEYEFTAYTHVDIEYLYVIDCTKQTLQCYKVLSDWKQYKDIMKKANLVSLDDIEPQDTYAPQVETEPEKVEQPEQKDDNLLFYTYSQNNSGGRFVINEDIKNYVIIQAHNENEANDKATDIGIYFDGVEKGIDCPCCGNRWERADETNGKAQPSLFGKNVLKDKFKYIFGGKEEFIIYYADGTQKIGELQHV